MSHVNPAAQSPSGELLGKQNIYTNGIILYDYIYMCMFINIYVRVLVGWGCITEIKNISPWHSDLFVSTLLRACSAPILCPNLIFYKIQLVFTLQKIKLVKHKFHDDSTKCCSLEIDRCFTYRHSSSISCTKNKNFNVHVSNCSCLGPIHWSQVLSREWRWSSADRRYFNYIWVISKFIAY